MAQFLFRLPVFPWLQGSRFCKQFTPFQTDLQGKAIQRVPNALKAQRKSAQGKRSAALG